MKNKHNLLILKLILFFLFSLDVHGKEDPSSSTTDQPPSIGNFALSSSQQPGPLVSFGQNIIDKDQLQLFLESTYLKTATGSDLTANPSLLYGLYDNASFYISMPIALNYRSGGQHSSGISDTTFQVEYAFHEISTTHYTTQATIVTSTTMPSGSPHKSPSTGNGTTTLFLGTTYNITFVDWLFFVSPGALMPTTHNNSKPGTQYFYQFGAERIISGTPNKYIFASMMEIDGIYTKKSSVLGQSLPDTGGNTIGITPSLWFSTKQLVAQLGISIPILQQLNGDQSKTNYLITANFAWTNR